MLALAARRRRKCALAGGPNSPEISRVNTLMKAVTFLATLTLLQPAASRAADEWKPLFDGKSLDGWTTRDRQPVTKGWKVEDAAIHRAGPGGDIFTTGEFLNFELEFDWKLAPGSNSGLKYRVADYSPAGKTIGLEYQILDDKGHADGQKPKTSAGSLYDLVPPSSDKTVKPVGGWNQSRIVARGNTLEHWLNGVKLLSIDLGSASWKSALGSSKFRAAADFGTKKGRILLQDHGGEVWLRNLRIRSLPDA
jgi:Domain of Unknown Function (DUF1080)